MKTRIISAAILLAVLVPIFLIGGMPFIIAVYLIAMLGLKEFLGIRQTKKAIPDFIKFISYIIFSLLVLVNITNKKIVFMIDFRIITALFISLLVPVVLYHNRKEYSVNDAFYLIGGIFFLGVSFNLLIILRNINMNYIIYLFMITIFTDTYAYLTGMLIGRTKLLEAISPNKTWEGMLGGTLFGSLIAGTFFHVVIDPALPIYVVAFMTIFLSILGQYGDLVFSAIKRYFGKKDFSNLIPGHGGILDRFDSIIFVILGFMFFVTII